VAVLVCIRTGASKHQDDATTGEKQRRINSGFSACHDYLLFICN
jgi:hypothetical protein